jgi:cytochrome c
MSRSLALAAALISAASACAALPAAPGANADAPPAALAARGRALFLRCASCHEVEDRGLTKTGPTLKGVYGRAAGAVPGYGYSVALKSRSLVWDAAALDAWLMQPSAVVPETSMVFIGVPIAEDRKALIAYLQTLK